QAPARRVDLDPTGMVELAFAEDEVAIHQKPAGLAFHRYLPLHRRIVARRDRVDRDGAVLEAVDPAAGAEAGVEGRRQGQMSPTLVQVWQYAEAAGARDVVGVARYRKQFVEGGISDRQLGAEHAMHPAGRAQRGVIEQHPLAAAQQRAMTARDDLVLVA